MIEGLKIEFTTQELHDHLAKRVAYHREKAKWYQDRVKDLKAGGETANFHASNDPTASLLQSGKSHDERAGFFQVVADHLVSREVYRLSDQDLLRLELADRVFF